MFEGLIAVYIVALLLFRFLEYKDYSIGEKVIFFLISLSIIVLAIHNWFDIISVEAAILISFLGFVMFMILGVVSFVRELNKPLTDVFDYGGEVK